MMKLLNCVELGEVREEVGEPLSTSGFQNKIEFDERAHLRRVRLSAVVYRKGRVRVLPPAAAPAASPYLRFSSSQQREMSIAGSGAGTTRQLQPETHQLPEQLMQ